jgi:hypothetical protein
VAVGHEGGATHPRARAVLDGPLDQGEQPRFLADRIYATFARVTA